MTIEEQHDILTTLDFADVWGVERSAAQKRAERWANRLGIRRTIARSPSGQLLHAYSRRDGERIIKAQRERDASRESNRGRNKEKNKEIEYEIGTANRPDVITVHELAEILGVSRSRATQIAQRLEVEIGISRVPARAASTQKIIAYMRSDGERLVDLFNEKRMKKQARRRAKEDRERERAIIPQPPAPSSRKDLVYLVELWPGDSDVYKIGWTSDIEQRLRTYRTTSPNLRLVKSWACDRKRDREAMVYAFSFQGLEKLSPETFRAQDIQAVVRHLDQFFR